MTTWIVTDARGKRHEVTADSMSNYSEGVIFRNTTAKEFHLEMVASFKDYRHVIPKGSKPVLIPRLAFLRKMWRKYS